MILYFSADLMSTSRVQGPARQQGIDLQTVASQKGCLEAISPDVTALLVDLNPPARDAVATIAAARAQHPDLRIVAHGPHVQVEMFRAAREAGASDVLTNGQFHKQVGEVLLALAAKTE